MVVLLILFCLSKNYGQVLKILDFDNKTPIPFVTISQKSKNLVSVTDTLGNVDISKFDQEFEIEIRHIGYQNLKTNYDYFFTNNFLVYLKTASLSINQVIVSANKWIQTADQLPNKIINITQDDIYFNNSQTTADLLASTGEVFVQKSQFGGGSPKLRGFSANSILLVVDGIRMNNAIYRSGNLQNVLNIDPLALENGEVFMGPGSVIYGSDALGGVMSFKTKKLIYANDTNDLKMKSSAYFRYSSASNEKTFHTDLNLGWKKVSIFTSFSKSLFDDLISGSNRQDGYSNFGKRLFYSALDLKEKDIIIKNNNPNVQIGSGFGSYNFIQKIGFRFNDNLEATYAFMHSNTSNIPRYDLLIETGDDGLPNNAEWYYGPQKWEMNYLKINFIKPTYFFDQLNFITGHQLYEESRNDRKFLNEVIRNRSEKVNILNFNIDLDKKLPKGNIFYGSEAVFNDVKSDAHKLNILTNELNKTVPRYPDNGSKYWSYAFYAKYIWNISNQWIVNSGVRYNNVRLLARMSNNFEIKLPDNELTISNRAINGSLGIVFHPNSSTKLNMIVASGFRTPNVDDVGKVFDFSDGELQVPNPTLKPEYTYNYEFGIQSNLMNNSKISFTSYYTQLLDAIVKRDYLFEGRDSVQFDSEFRKVVALTNTGKANIYGLSFQSNYTFPSVNLNLYGNLTWVNGKDLTNNEPLRHTTPLFGKIGLEYNDDEWKISLYSEFNGPRWRADIPTSEIDDKPFLYAKHDENPKKDGSPPWQTLNLKFSYFARSQFLISGGIENITDQHYRPYSSGISSSGRNYIASLQIFINN